MTIMQTRSFKVRFTTPAFLGNAEQNGQWRTPPFKHLLREWWRVAWVADSEQGPGGIDALRREEARLFGTASDGEGCRSLVRLHLKCWEEGKLKHWEGDRIVHHPEVDKNEGRIGAHLYLGYGPLTFKQGKTFLGKKERGQFKEHTAIQAGAENTLRLAFPESDAQVIDHALALMHAFGTLGGRARNGWGSISLEGDIEAPQLPLRDWEECLGIEWAHAIGRDEHGALIWRTKKDFNDWQSLMRELARIKIGLRTRFPFHSGKNARQPEERHWLSYPVTNHSVRPWDEMGRRERSIGARIPNTLRFKVRSGGNGRLYGVIFHMPCRPPQAFRPNDAVLRRVWRQVHRFLDENDALKRCSS